jgi:PAS domain S-box-containing protein
MRESYRVLFESSPQAMFVFEPETLRFLDANHACVRLYGYAREELLGMSLADLWPAEDAERNREFVRTASESFVATVRHRKKDGTPCTVDVVANLVSFDEGTGRLALLTDVTARVVAEQARRAAEARFTRLADSGMLGIIVTSVDGRVHEINEALLDILGYSREGILSGSVPWNAVTPPEWRDLDERARQQLSSSGTAGLREKEFVRKDGSRVPVLVGSAMLEGEDKECISFVLDLRGSRQIEAAVKHLGEARASEATFRGFVEAAPDSVVVANRQGTIVLVNAQTERLYGYTRDELVGQGVEMMLAERFRAQFPSRLAGYFAGTRVAPTGPVSLDVYGRRKDGSEFPIEFTVALLETAGETLVCGSIRDTTERKRAEEQRQQLATMVESSDDAIIGKSLAGIVTSWNAAAERLFGYSAAEMIGQPIARLFPPDQQGEEPEILAHLAAGEVERFDGVRLHKDGRRIEVSVTIAPVRDPTGRIVGACKVVRDITDRRRAEVALRQAKDAAEAANRELESFSYSVAHDLRAPLRGMNGFARLLLDRYRDALDPTGQDWLEEITLNARKMGELIDGLLSLARVTRSELRRGQVDLSSTARAALGQLAKNEPDRRVELAVEEGLSAEVDPALARALLDNLLGNAWKFTRDAAPARIEVGATLRDGDRAFFVRDNGAGFDMAFASKLFVPFQRLHAAAEFPGTGIGLATVQRIVRRHGGRVWAEGTVGAGATFYFTFSEPKRSAS